MNKFKLIATDLDGTLLDDNSTISKENINAIKNCVKNGIHVVLISGRAPASINNFLKQLDLKKDNIFAAGFHGGCIFNVKDSSIVHQISLDKSLAEEILAFLKNIDDVGVLVYEGDMLYSHNVNEEVEAYMNRAFAKVYKVDSYDDIQGNISKILVHGKMEQLIEVEKICEKFKSRCKVMYTGYNLLEFTNEDGNKGDALNYICKLLNIDIADTVSIGDNYNDIELIKAAGVGVATYNAIEDLKAIADYITIKDNNKGAVAEVIEKYFELS